MLLLPHDVAYGHRRRCRAAPGVLAVDASGRPAQLAEIAATWFETVLRRPVIRVQRQGPRGPESQWRFGDTGEPLVETRDWPATTGPETVAEYVRGPFTT